MDSKKVGLSNLGSKPLELQNGGNWNQWIFKSVEPVNGGSKGKGT